MLYENIFENVKKQKIIALATYVHRMYIWTYFLVS